MFKKVTLIAIMTLIAIIGIGCQNHLPVAPENRESGGLAPRFTLPTGASIDSASMFIYVNIPNGQTVDVHRVTADWSGASITWNNFGGAYDAAVMGSLVVASGG